MFKKIEAPKNFLVTDTAGKPRKISSEEVTKITEENNQVIIHLSDDTKCISSKSLSETKGWHSIKHKDHQQKTADALMGRRKK